MISKLIYPHKSLWAKISFEWRLRKAIRLGKKVHRLECKLEDELKNLHLTNGEQDDEKLL